MICLIYATENGLYDCGSEQKSDRVMNLNNKYRKTRLISSFWLRPN